MDVVKDLDAYSHIKVEKKYLLETGEVSVEYLAKYGGTKKWSEMKFDCNHCHQRIKGLLSYMDHMREAGIKRYKIKCTEDDCCREYAALYSFINHAAEHDLHLAFSCVFCVPTSIFYNIPCLLNHYLASHMDVQFAFYMCLECATYCQSITQLQIHKMSQHDKVYDITDLENDSDESDGIPKRKQSRLEEDVEWTPVNLNLNRSKSYSNIASKSNQVRTTTSAGNLLPSTSTPNSSREFHQKVRNTENRTLYPCTFEGCNRVLITPAGFDYHILTHSGKFKFLLTENCQFLCKKILAFNFNDKNI